MTSFCSGSKRHDGKQSGDYAEQYANPRIDGPVMVYVQCDSAAHADQVRAEAGRLGGEDLQQKAPGG
ncbi:hypothetical protein V8Z80_07240 [Orrella sp. JC864]|uniref:hypothetical protein n=1 Tax=Orrella sp. JC864 TaxID=3120298 RepID=UPI003008986A